MRWLDSITDLTDMNVSKRQEIVKDREAWSAAVCEAAKSCLTGKDPDEGKDWVQEEKAAAEDEMVR